MRILCVSKQVGNKNEKEVRKVMSLSRERERRERERERERERVTSGVTLINLHFFYIIDF